MKIWLLSLALLLAGCSRDPESDPEYAAACHGPPLRTAEARSAALEQGYSVNEQHDCVDKFSYQRRQWEIQRDKADAAEAAARAPVKVDRTLAGEREGFTTEVSLPATEVPLPAPPAELFRRHEYDAARGLVAFVTPDPGDGAKHPAIL